MKSANRKGFRSWVYDCLGKGIIKCLDLREGRSRKKEKPLPRISIVTPVLNAESTIVETIESILSQNYPDLEYIIIDAGSTDGTLKRIEPFRGWVNTLISEPDCGMYDALNKGFARATGDVFAYLNADDYYLPGGLQRVGAYFRDHQKVEVIYHEDIVEVMGWRFPNLWQPHVDYRHLANGHILFQDGVFFSRRAFEEAGGFNGKLKLAGDWEMWARLAFRFPFQRMDGHVSCFRIHEGQLTSIRERYDNELERAKDTLLKDSAPLKREVSLLHCLRNSMRNHSREFFNDRRLFFPIPFEDLPPPECEVPVENANSAVCPVTGATPDRFLFSSPDTRFGDGQIHDWYYVARSSTAICHPTMESDVLSDLYERHYSSPTPSLVRPAEETGSPYRNFNGSAGSERWLGGRSLPKSLRRRLGLTWEDTTAEELLKTIGVRFPTKSEATAFLDIGCFEGKLLEDLRERTQWKLSGLESNEKAVGVARKLGLEFWHARAEDAVYAIPIGRQFDLIFLGQTVEHLQEPLVTLRRLRQLLRPSGILVLSTPNLNSWQIDRFGPTWPHWHPPYHRHIFSIDSLKQMGLQANLEMRRWRTFSHPYWSAMSLQLNELGLAGAVPHGIAVPEAYRERAESMAAWSKLLWDWRGRGDYLYVVYGKG